MSRNMKLHNEVIFAVFFFHDSVVVCRLFFKNYLSKLYSETLSECQMVWIQIRTDGLSVLIWVQTVWKGYQQMTKLATSKERLKDWFDDFLKVQQVCL